MLCHILYAMLFSKIKYVNNIIKPNCSILDYALTVHPRYVYYNVSSSTSDVKPLHILPILDNDPL